MPRYRVVVSREVKVLRQYTTYITADSPEEAEKKVDELDFNGRLSDRGSEDIDTDIQGPTFDVEEISDADGG